MGHIKDWVLNPDEAVLSFLDAWHNGDDYIVAHSSGSTGKPKPISLLKRDMKLSARATNRFFGIGEGDYLKCPLSCNYIAGKMMVVRAIEAGAMVDFSKDVSVENDMPVKLMSVVPAQLATLFEAPDALKTVENLLIGGSPLMPEMEDELLSAGVNAFVSYGMTETCSHIAIRRCGEDHYTTLLGINISADKRGCLRVHAPGSSFDGIVTNDIIEHLSDQTFRWVGRYDNAIISGGVKVFAEEIERKLRDQIPADVKYYITWEPHPRWGQAVVLVTDTPVTSVDMTHLSPAERPKRTITAQMRYTESGKIKRLRPKELSTEF